MDQEKKRKRIDHIVQEIFELDEPAIDKKRADEMRSMLASAINGDEIEEYLVINLDNDAVVYIVTNYRVITLKIDSNKIHSEIYALSDIVKIEIEKLAAEDRIETSVTFHDNTTIGLNYPADDTKASKFFQTIDKLRVIKK